jgi:hypothetical protein
VIAYRFSEPCQATNKTHQANHELVAVTVGRVTTLGRFVVGMTLSVADGADLRVPGG